MNEGDDAAARAREVPLAGYSDRLSVRGGGRIAFKVSTTSPGRTIEARLTRSISADPNPDGPGIVEEPCDAHFAPLAFRGRHQPLRAGSFGLSDEALDLGGDAVVALEVLAWPTLHREKAQTLLGVGALALQLDADGRFAARCGSAVARLPGRAALRRWVRLRAVLDRDAGTLSIGVADGTREDEAPDAAVLADGTGSEAVRRDTTSSDTASSDTAPFDTASSGAALAGRVSIGARLAVDPAPRSASDRSSGAAPDTAADAASDPGTGTVANAVADPVAGGSAGTAANGLAGAAVEHFNGKLEAPTVLGGAGPDALGVRARWDFARGTSTTRIEDTGPAARHGRLVNLPARAMTGARWDGSETCWRHAPAHYAAIHFHEDDLVDAGWETDFVFDVPPGMPSGVYVMRLDDGEHADAMPFWVCAPRGAPGAALCVLVPTFTYAVYGNHARPDWTPAWRERVAEWNAYPWNPAEYPGYGLSTYNDHADGSGICHASHRRPLFNLRPGYLTFSEPGHAGSGLRHFQADSHLFAWLHAKGVAYDVITDRELHEEGVACLAPYRAVTTTTHPEYHTAETLDALGAYRDGGGNLLYLGGNGFYWRVALHPEEPSAIEIRRAEAGIRAWAAEPGEYWQAFDGAYGGLWRRNGRPPQALVGVGFSAQGRFDGSHYRRCNHDPALAWLFDGIDGDVVGDQGLSGGGAAGFELDRADTRLGTPGAAVVVASSEGHGEDFVLVPEEVLTHLTTLPGEPARDLLRADMLWYETPAGGALFAVGSITFCGALPCGGFDNDVSTLLGNVLGRVLGTDDG